jgi:hypothetical protein
MNTAPSFWEVENLSQSRKSSQLAGYTPSSSPYSNVMSNILDVSMLPSIRFRASKFPSSALPESLAFGDKPGYRPRNCVRRSADQIRTHTPTNSSFRVSVGEEAKRIRKIGLKCMFCKKISCVCFESEDSFIEDLGTVQESRRKRRYDIMKDCKLEKNAFDNALSESSRLQARKFKTKTEITSMVNDLFTKILIKQNPKQKPKKISLVIN